jgi:hypothetical protein
MPIAGGPAVAVSQSTVESTFGVAYFPTDDRILVIHDHGGNENNHLYVIRDGKEQDLTPGKWLKVEFLQWTHDGSAFHIRTNEREAKIFDIYRLAVSDYARTLVDKDEVGMRPATFPMTAAGSRCPTPRPQRTATFCSGAS